MEDAAKKNDKYYCACCRACTKRLVYLDMRYLNCFHSWAHRMDHRDEILARRIDDVGIVSLVRQRTNMREVDVSAAHATVKLQDMLAKNFKRVGTSRNITIMRRQDSASDIRKTNLSTLTPGPDSPSPDIELSPSGKTPRGPTKTGHSEHLQMLDLSSKGSEKPKGGSEKPQKTDDRLAAAQEDIRQNRQNIRLRGANHVFRRGTNSRRRRTRSKGVSKSSKHPQTPKTS